MNFTLFNEIRRFKSLLLLECPKIELQIIFRLHHHLSIDHDIMFILIKNESKHFDSCILILYLNSEIFFWNSKMWTFSFIYK